MKNVCKFVIGAFAAICVSMIPSTSKADDLTIKVEPGVAVPLTTPQSNRFSAGGDLAVKGLWGVTNWLGVGASTSALVLPTDVSGLNTGTAWTIGPTVRIMRPRDSTNLDSGWREVSPWVDADLQYVRTGTLDRAGMSVAVGAAYPTSVDRSLWVGPMVRYQGVFQPDSPGLDGHSAKMLIVGLSMEFGPSSERPVPEKDSDGDGLVDSKDRCPNQYGPVDNQGCPRQVATTVTQEVPVVAQQPVAQQVKLSLSQRVQFPWDSAKLDSAASQSLNQVVAELSKHLDVRVQVEGHASSEGRVEHNNKLSQKRADAVVNFLVAHGVPRDRLTAKGFGSSVPVADNATESGRVANRRVEFVVDFVILK